MNYENAAAEGNTGRAARTSQTEGASARAIEKQTSKIPSDFFLWTGIGAIVGSIGLHLMGKRETGNFVATWVPTVLLLGLYNKVVKLGGHDRYQQQVD